MLGELEKQHGYSGPSMEYRVSSACVDLPKAAAGGKARAAPLGGDSCLPASNGGDVNSYGSCRPAGGTCSGNDSDVDKLRIQRAQCIERQPWQAEDQQDEVPVCMLGPLQGPLSADNGGQWEHPRAAMALPVLPYRPAAPAGMAAAEAPPRQTEEGDAWPDISVDLSGGGSSGAHEGERPEEARAGDNASLAAPTAEPISLSQQPAAAPLQEQEHQLKCEQPAAGTSAGDAGSGSCSAGAQQPEPLSSRELPEPIEQPLATVQPITERDSGSGQQSGQLTAAEAGLAAATNAAIAGASTAPTVPALLDLHGRWAAVSMNNVSLLFVDRLQMMELLAVERLLLGERRRSDCCS